MFWTLYDEAALIQSLMTVENKSTSTATYCMSINEEVVDIIS